MPLYDYTVSQSLEGDGLRVVAAEGPDADHRHVGVQRRQSGAGADPACKSLAITLGGLGGASVRRSGSSGELPSLGEAGGFDEGTGEFGVGLLPVSRKQALFPSIRTIGASFTISGRMPMTTAMCRKPNRLDAGARAVLAARHGLDKGPPASTGSLGTYLGRSPPLPAVFALGLPLACAGISDASGSYDPYPYP